MEASVGGSLWKLSPPPTVEVLTHFYGSKCLLPHNNKFTSMEVHGSCHESKNKKGNNVASG